MPKWCSFPNLGQRHVFVLLSHFGVMLAYIYRTNLSVALVAMVNSTNLTPPSENETVFTECAATLTNATVEVDQLGEFFWNEQEQGILLGAFFWGYLVMQLPAGFLVQRFGGKWPFAVGVVGTALLNLTTPPVARWTGLRGTIALRAMEGLVEGVVFPAMHSLTGHWFHPLEVTILAQLAYSGTDIGRIIGTYVTGALCESTAWWGGWPSAFYISGILGLVWCPFWCIFVFDDPNVHPRISNTEKQFLNSIRERETHPSLKDVQYCAILRTPAVWAYFICSFLSLWTSYTFMTSLPQYFKNVLHFSLTETGAVASMPYVLTFLVGIGCSFVADTIRSRGYLSTTWTRKVFTLLGFLLSAVFTVSVGFVGCDRMASVTMLILVQVSMTLIASGCGMNDLDLAPNMAGILFSMGNTMGTMAGILGPAVVGYLTNNAETIAEWSILFYITAGLDVFGAILYLLIGSGEQQWWSLKAYAELNEEVVDDESETQITNSSEAWMTSLPALVDV